MMMMLGVEFLGGALGCWSATSTTRVRGADGMDWYKMGGLVGWCLSFSLFLSCSPFLLLATSKYVVLKWSSRSVLGLALLCSSIATMRNTIPAAALMCALPLATGQHHYGPSKWNGPHEGSKTWPGHSYSPTASASAAASSSAGSQQQTCDMLTAAEVEAMGNNTLFNRWRPRSHFLAPAGWMNDPCAPIYDPTRDVYHLFYQWHPQHINWGNISWGYATSKDMVTWEDHVSCLRT